MAHPPKSPVPMRASIMLFSCCCCSLGGGAAAGDGGDGGGAGDNDIGGEASGDGTGIGGDALMLVRRRRRRRRRKKEREMAIRERSWWFLAKCKLLRKRWIFGGANCYNQQPTHHERRGMGMPGFCLLLAPSHLVQAWNLNQRF